MQPLPLPDDGRQRHRHFLPVLGKMLAQVKPPQTPSSKLDYTMAVVRRVAGSLRARDSVPFYSMREFQRLLGVSLHTVSAAFERLESEGLLVRLRGARTRVTGTQSQSMTPILGVVGWMENVDLLRHYEWRRELSRGAGDGIRRSHFVTETLLYGDDKASQGDLLSRARLRKPDIAVWLQPPPSLKATLRQLQKVGVRNLVVCDQEWGQSPEGIMINWEDAFATVLDDWRERFQIRKIIAIGGDTPSCSRVREFRRLAGERGMSWERKPFTPELPEICARRMPAGRGIVILDEWSAVEFCQPSSFLAALRRHRILFTRGLPCVPSVPLQEYEVDLLCYPVMDIVENLRKVLRHGQTGEVTSFVVNGVAKLGGEYERK